MYLNGPDLRSVSRGHVIPQGDVSPDPLPKLANFWGRTRAEGTLCPPKLALWPAADPPLCPTLCLSPRISVCELTPMNSDERYQV